MKNKTEEVKDLRVPTFNGKKKQLAKVTKKK